MKGDDPVTALAMRVEELAREVDEARQQRAQDHQDAAAAKADVARWNARVEVEVIGPVVSMRTAIKKLREDLDAMSATLGTALDRGKLKAPVAPDWDSLDKDQRAAQLAALRDWVNRVLLGRYPEYTFPGCWEHHPAALWELGNLRAEWQRIYCGPRGADLGADLEAALWFHERWLPGTLSRLNKAINTDGSGCRDHHGASSRKASGW